MSNLIFRHIPIFYFLDYNKFEVVVELMSRLEKVLVDGDRIPLLRVIPVLVNPFVGSLNFNFAHILLPIAFHAKPKVYRVLGLASHSVSDVESFITGLVGKVRRRYDMSATFCVRSAPARCASSNRSMFFP